MLLLIVRRQFFDQFQSLRFAIACAVCLVLLPINALVLTRHYQEARALYSYNAARHHDEVVQRTTTWSASRGWKVDRPVNVMNTLVRGIFSPRTETIQPEKVGLSSFGNLLRHPLEPLLTEVDYAFAVGLVMSLLALVFSFDSVSGERETDLLRLLLSYGLPRDCLLLGKWLGGYISLITPFLLGFFVSMLVIGLFAQTQFTLDEVLSVLGLLGLALLYLAAIFSLGLLVSCRTRQSATSITVLLLVWAALVLVWPNAAPYVAATLYPVPSQQSVERELAGIDLAGRQRWQAELGGKTDDLDESANQERQALHEAIWREVAKQKERIKERYAAAMRKQTSWAEALARLSPLASFKLAAGNMAATGPEQERRFVEALQQYTIIWNQYALSKTEPLRRIWDKREDPAYAGEVKRLSKADFSDYPRFVFSYMPFSERLRTAGADILLLTLWNAIFFMASHLSFLRQDVH